MTMGFKYQLISCTFPVQILQVTLIHLESLKKICQSNTISCGLIQSCIQRLIDVYSPFTDAQWIAV